VISNGVLGCMAVGVAALLAWLVVDDRRKARREEAQAEAEMRAIWGMAPRHPESMLQALDPRTELWLMRLDDAMFPEDNQ
jgi:hypothetical protein